MGESIAEGTITKWLVQPGDRVERDQPLLEISTDKVDAEIPSPASGVITEIRAKEGETIPVNQVVAVIGEGSEAAAKPAPAAAPEPAKPAAAAPPAEKPAAEGETEKDLSTFASPVVKRMAVEHGIDLSQVEGTGSQGRVTKQDLEGHLEKRPAAPSAPSAPAPAPAAPAAAARPAGGDFWVPAYTEGERVTLEPMSKIRQITAAHMRYSKDTSAHVTTLFEFDFSRVARIRARAKGGFERANGTKLSFMPFVIKAVASALRAHRKINAAIDGINIVYKQDVNVGIAVALDWGLVVPVIRNADQLSLTGIAKVGNDLADRARAKKLSPDELKGGTFTITNPGVFGSLFGTPVINQPQVAILGIGAIQKRVVVETDANGNDALAIRTMAYMPITYDHRLIDGADADHFMNAVKRIIEEDPWAELEPFL
jgi:2-oxoglutarate dehydrogenase E2 component (dihydrolipoamide succinyltransferase)